MSGSARCRCCTVEASGVAEIAGQDDDEVVIQTEHVIRRLERSVWSTEQSREALYAVAPRSERVPRGHPVLSSICWYARDPSRPVTPGEPRD